MNVTVFGIGYVGLVQAAVLAEVGHNVICVDVDSSKIEALRRCDIPIFEPDLAKLVARGLREGRLHFTTDPKSGVDHSELQFIAVGTPPNDDSSADLRYVLAVARTIADHLKAPKIVVNKSTVPVGTSDLIGHTISESLSTTNRDDIGCHVVSNPEFLKEGSAVADCTVPDRIIIGTESSYAEAVLRELYAPFNSNYEKIIVMDARSAELTKYAANCMLATKISFMNEIAMIADKLGADVERVRQGIGSDPRIGDQFIYPGIGYGGSCFPKDVRALVHAAEKVGADPVLLRAVETRNTDQKQVLFKKIEAHFDGDLDGRTFALWGLSFKPNTDDMREAPSRSIIESLWAAGASVRAYDPEAMDECVRIYGKRRDLTLVQTKEEALRGADALVIATEWKAFRTPDFELIRDSIREPVIFDGRNLYDPAAMRDHQIAYYCIGRQFKATHSVTMTPQS